MGVFTTAYGGNVAQASPQLLYSQTSKDEACHMHIMNDSKLSFKWTSDNHSLNNGGNFQNKNTATNFVHKSPIIQIRLCDL